VKGNWGEIEERGEIESNGGERREIKSERERERERLIDPNFLWFPTREERRGKGGRRGG
jgi:hypothetical protein